MQLKEHLLFGKLSGQVIWNLLEETGASQSQIDSFMDWFEAEKTKTSALLAELASNKEGALRFVVEGSGEMCAECSALEGLVIAARHPDLRLWLPPFSLACRLRAVFINDEFELSKLGELKLPTHRLCCPARPLSRFLAEDF